MSDYENVYSNEYFARICKLLNDYGYDYNGRRGFYHMSNIKATNKINAVLNFYYGLIEHRLLNDISYYNLDYNISFLHEPQYNKISLTYDLIELLRSDIDRVVLRLAEKRMIKDSDFTLNDGYYLIKEERIKKYLKELAPVEKMTKDTVETFLNILSQ